MNRADRRAARARLRAQADRVAAVCARTCSDLGQGSKGPHRAVADPVAIRALERAFAHVLRNGGEPHVMALRPEEGAALASKGTTPAGGSWFLAAGIDRLGRASYVSRRVLLAVGSPTEVRREVEAHLLAELRPVLEDTAPVSVLGGWK